MGIELEITKPSKVVAQTLKICLKVSDQFSCRLLDDRGHEIAEQEEGYVPSFMPGEHHGDYVILEIDFETGKIQNWKTPCPEKVQEWIEEVSQGRNGNGSDD